jgi:hypothetical protein
VIYYAIPQKIIELTEKKWNDEVSRLANHSMLPTEQDNLLKLVNYRFNWKRNNEVRDSNNQFKRERMPVEKNITCNLKTPPMQIHKHIRSTSSTLSFPISEWAAPATTTLKPLDD